ncbi:MAG TPA: hypothetical protein VFU43_00245 [Streptosporangiaceae bacterium]|nr:hypothetical protein [Streptosporangiaceae bacterium]
MPTDPPPPPGGPPPPPGPPPYGQDPYGAPNPYWSQPPPNSPPPPHEPRKRNTTAIVLIAVAAIAATALVTTAIMLGTGIGDDASRSAMPLRIEQVVASSAGACVDGAGVPSSDGTTCYQLTTGGLTIARFQKVEVMPSAVSRGWLILLTLRPDDGVAFERLTTQVHQARPPRNQLALVVDGRVISAPTVQGPISGGKVQIEGNFTRDAAQHIADQLDG